ncbi:origin recognition complex subunit 6 [Sitodiplosis mosellana]|uniref:origin recognition complex subunit 6 n=1 Tax=Sitodiplosis mosellana TaxID=263140 RepID=UPI0024446D96|nr:origin recognition complex subunit 6 [Sitodiplosis mosellana]
MSEKLLIEYCQRVGVLDDDVIEKSKEYLRLIGMKKCTSNETVKIVLSIDCAASSCNSEFQTEVAIQLSGLKKKEYGKQKGLFEKLLDLGKKSTLDAAPAKENGRTNKTKNVPEISIPRKDQNNSDKNTVQVEPEIQSYEEWRDCMIKRAKEELEKIRQQ